MNYDSALEVLRKIGGQDLVDEVEKEMARQKESTPADGPPIDEYGYTYFSGLFLWLISERGDEFWLDIDDKFRKEVSNELR